MTCPSSCLCTTPDPARSQAEYLRKEHGRFDQTTTRNMGSNCARPSGCGHREQLIFVPVLLMASANKQPPTVIPKQFALASYVVHRFSFLFFRVIEIDGIPQDDQLAFWCDNIGAKPVPFAVSRKCKRNSLVRLRDRRSKRCGRLPVQQKAQLITGAGDNVRRDLDGRTRSGWQTISHTC